MVGNRVIPVNSMNMGLLPHFLCYEVCSLIRSNVVWNVVMENKAFFKSTDGSFGRSIVYKEGKFISIVSIPIRKKDIAPSIMEVV